MTHFHKPIVISFRRKDQLSEDVIWSVFSKIAESNARYNAMERLIVVIHSVRMPVGFGKTAVKSMGRPLSVMAHVKRSIINDKAETNCLAHALVIAIASLTKDPNYKAYREGKKRLEVEHLLQTTGINLQNGEESRNSSESKTTLRSTKSSFMEGWIVLI